MHYFVLSPIIPGTIADGTEFDRSDFRTKTEKLHFEFDNVPDDDFICGGGDVFLAAPSLAEAFARAGLTGFSIAEATLSVGGNFMAVEGHSSVPSYQWLKIEGVPGRDDFGIFDGFTIVVSKRVVDVLGQFTFSEGSSTKPFTASLRRSLWASVEGRPQEQTLDESISLPED